jgi:hypothetical protein
MYLDMECSHFHNADDREIRFLEYRLDVIDSWPDSPRKQAVAEAISRRLASIARAALLRQELHGLLYASCRLLDRVFSGSHGAANASWRAA